MSLYNEDELLPPSWIDEEFLKKVLSNNGNNDEVWIMEYNLKPATLKGDHYASIMFRCQVSYSSSANVNIIEKSLIIKTMPMEEGPKREMLLEGGFFETEVSMYTKVLPRIEDILAYCGEPTRLKADVLYHSLEPYQVIVFEDLCQAGYDTVRDRFLTELEIKAVYAKIAKLHAVSYMLGRHKDEHEFVTKYQNGYFNVPIIREILKSGSQNFLNLLTSHQEFASYAEKFKVILPDLEQKCEDMFNAYALNNGRGDIFVLNHGDFHMKNLMIKYSDENKLDDIMMVDYQISCYAPSSVDLLYSQFLMLDSDLRLKRHELMYFYFTEFLRILKKIECPEELPKYSEFQMANLKYRHFTIFMLACILPMVVHLWGKSVEELRNIDTKKVSENSDSNAEMYNETEFIDEIRKLLPILLNEGYLD